MIAYSRPFLPLFLHILGAMTLVGAILAVLVLTAAIPAWIVMRVGAEWIYAKEFGSSNANDPTWVGIGFAVADAGLLVLLVTSGVAFWWNRAGTQFAGRLVGGLAGLYLVLLAVAWLAMSGKWS